MVCAKNLPNTVAWFCQEFHDDEDVGLVVKTFAKGNSQIDKNFMKVLFNKIEIVNANPTRTRLGIV